MGETERGAWERLTWEIGSDSQRSLGEIHKGAWERLTGELGRNSQGKFGRDFGTHRGNISKIRRSETPEGFNLMSKTK